MTERPKFPAGAGALLAALAAYLGVVAIFPRAAAMSLLSDDAYYYVKIARSIVQGNGSTFDGIALTNGYHPLWMLCNVAIQWVDGSDLVSPLRLLMMVSGLLAALTLILVYRIVDRFVAPGYGVLAVAACLLPNVITALTNGLETGPLLFALAALVWAWHRWSLGDPEAGPKKRFALGLLLGVVFLCRLDSAFIALAAIGLNALALLARGVSVPRTIGRATPIGLGIAVPAAAFFAWNLGSFGHLTPISGAMKTSFPSVRESLALNGDLSFGLALLVVVTVLVAFSAAAWIRSGRPLSSVLSDPLLALWGGCVLHYLHAFLFLDWGVYWWHMAPYGLTLALALPAAARHVRWEWRRAFLTGVLAATIAAFGLFVQFVRVSGTGGRHGVWLRAAEWARDNTEPGAVFALKDAGLFGYFSDRAVVNLDGKANGYRYCDFVRRGDVEEYLREVGTEYLADTRSEYHEGLCRIYVPRVNRPAIAIDAREAWEVYASPPVPPRPFQAKRRSEASFRIWRLPEDGEEMAAGDDGEASGSR